MKRVIGLFYKKRVRISIVLICCSVFFIFFRMISSDSKQHIPIDQSILNNRFVKNHLLEKEILIEKNNIDSNNNLINLIKPTTKVNLNERIINFNAKKQFQFNQQIPFITNRINEFQINDRNQFNPNQNQNQNNINFLANLERIVHIDLKGAPPKPHYFKQFIPFIKQFGATGILLEYEDMFPFEGTLAEARHGNAYSPDDVNMIKNLAKENGLKIIPLVQTYGHLEWLLKIKKFAHLREVSEYPQVITPCLEESYRVIFEMLDQVIKYHSDASEFHVGCDEVYYKLAHEKCATLPNSNDFAQVFLRHLVKIASYVRSKIPNVKVIFWDDMMHGMEEATLMQFKNEIEKLQLQPMMWGYMENVESYFQPDLYVKYGNVFGKIWIASAYKGASGELATITSIQHHYLNHISWIDVMREKISNKILQFIGVAITGWSRYDHFLTLCDILPQAIPSLIFNLQVMQHGPLNDQKKQEISKMLGCSGQIPWDGVVNYPVKCNFPGHEVYEAMLPLQSILQGLKSDIAFAENYVSPMNLEYAYLHKKRTSEVLERVRYTYTSMVDFKDRFIEACSTMYWPDVANEWLLVYFIPHFDPLFHMLERVKNLSSQKYWSPRPLPITLKQYPKYF